MKLKYNAWMSTLNKITIVDLLLNTGNIYVDFEDIWQVFIDLFFPFRIISMNILHTPSKTSIDLIFCLLLSNKSVVIY